MRRIDITILTSISISIFLLLILYILFPDVVYSQFIWKFFWGPVVADAIGHEVSYKGVIAREGYTLVSEVVYGMIALVCIYYMYRFLKLLKLSIDWKFCLSLLPFILFGSITRVLEDAHLFKIPLSYWFISPLIYIQIALYVVFLLVLSRVAEKIKRAEPKTILLLTLPTGYLISWFFIKDFVLFDLHPLVAFLISFAILLAYLPRMRKVGFDAKEFLFFSGLILLSFSIYPVIHWNPSDVRLDFFSLNLGLVSAIVLTLALGCRLKEGLKVFSQPFNVSMVFAHLLDGTTSYLSIYDPFNLGLPLYGEKHPIPSYLMGISGGVLYPVIKLVLVMLIIYILDILYAKELERHGDMVNILKIAIIILGLAPGTRDLMRVTLGT